MSNRFYDYLSKKLLDYFESNNLGKGERFFINFDEDDQVKDFYNSLKNLGKVRDICSPFIYKHEKGSEYSTYSLNIKDVNLVVATDLDVTDGYLVTLRNRVDKQEEVWEDSSLLIICNGAIDSISGGAKDLQKDGMPLSTDYISENLQSEIENSTSLDKVSKVIADFSLNNQKDELFQTTLWDYENILSIIENGSISSEDLKGLKLFKDDNLEQFTKNQMRNRLKENNELFEEIEKYSQYGDKKEQLEKKFKPAGVKLLNDDDWHLTAFNTVKKNILPKAVPLGYESSASNSVYWERPLSTTKAGLRKRNVIVFNKNSLSNRVSLEFKFDQMLKNEFLNTRSKNIAKTSGKSLKVEFDASSVEPTFKQVSYKHKGLNNSYYLINIAVLNAEPQVFDSIKSRYVVDVKNNRISVINDEDSDDIVFGNGSNVITKEISDEDETLYLYESDSILISETSPAWDDGVLHFNLKHEENNIAFEIKEKSRKAVPVKSSTIWSFKRQHEENFVFNGVKAVQNVNSFYLEDKFKDYLKWERQIITNDIFYGKLSVDGQISKEEVHFSPELENAYKSILDYYKYYDESPDDNLPSLMYLNDDLKELYEDFINIFNKEVSEIEENSVLSDDEFKKNLVKLGRIDTNDKILYSSLSPINIAYQLEVLNQCTDESLDLNMVERLVPNNLIPYVCSDDGKELYRPIFQEDAQEWLVYEKSEDVSIGTTNVFISNVVLEKLNQFVKHFDYLFAINPNAPLKVNLINITDDKEVVKGVFNFIRARLPDKVKTKHIIPIEINIYNDLEDSSFDTLFECDSKEQIFEEFGIKIKSDSLDEMDVIHLIQDNIKYYNHSVKDDDYGYAHISFYKVKSHTDIADDNMDKIDTGLSLNGLLSSVTSTTKHSEYRTGFGSKDILNIENRLVKTSINVNELVYNSRNFGKNTYSKNKSVVTLVELEEGNIGDLYEKSHWLTFIEPTFGIEYFDDENDVVIIHYSDQYSSSSKYDTITVTKKSRQYEEVIKDFLLDKNVRADREDITPIIKMFNSINGEWLLRIISNDENFGREKLSIVSAIKYCLAILDHDDIVWVPISMEEILRIAGNVKLAKSKGIFASNLKSGVHSDDLLFMGLKFNDDDTIEIIFYPMEVKVGNNPNQVIKKGKSQLMNTYNLIKEQMKKIDNEGSEFKNKFFRNFFIQIFLSNNQKFIINEIWPNKRFGRVESFKAKLLNDDYEVSYILEDYIGKGSLMSFKKDCHEHSVAIEEDKLIIELPEEYAYQGLVKSIDEIYNEIQNDSTDIESRKLLSSVTDLSSRKTKPYVPEYYDGEEEYSENVEDSDFDEDDELKEEFEDLGDSETIPGDIDIVSETSPVYTTEEIGAAGGDEEEEIFIEYSSDKEISDVRALIGTQEGYNRKIFWEFGNPAMGNRHMLIQGKSGQGKTYYIQRMLKELSTQGIPSIIVDYTDGFKKNKLEDEFKDSLGDKLEQHIVIANKFPLNPFKRNTIEIDEDVSIPEENSDIASRFKSIVNAVYNLGDQQLNSIYQAVIRGLDKYDEEMDLNKLREELEADESSSAATALSKLTELIDRNPFESTDFDWSVLDNSGGKVIVIQLTGLSKDIQRVISELVLWDLWNYKSSFGSEDNPFVVVLDEAHNLDFGRNSPCSKILAEGRKFGWSGWFATQSVKGLMKTEEIARLENAEEKIYFHPTDDSISNIASNFTNDINERRSWETKLSRLGKGQCIVYGPLMNSRGDVVPSDPVVVNIDEIVNDVVKSDDNNSDNQSPRR